jgi:hypothetical protein
MKLTTAQRTALIALLEGERSAYPSLSLATLNSLENKGLARSRGGFGSIFSPTTGIKWRLAAKVFGLTLDDTRALFAGKAAMSMSPSVVSRAEFLANVDRILIGEPAQSYAGLLWGGS